MTAVKEFAGGRPAVAARMVAHPVRAARRGAPGWSGIPKPSRNVLLCGVNSTSAALDE
jgi:hypothetical protein